MAKHRSITTPAGLADMFTADSGDILASIQRNVEINVEQISERLLDPDALSGDDDPRIQAVERHLGL